jgi:hypothetical protein
MSLEDPFDPAADPYPPAPRVTRREVAKLVAAAACVVSACVAPRRLACATKPEDRESCQARFCRYFRPR